MRPGIAAVVAAALAVAVAPALAGPAAEECAQGISQANVAACEQAIGENPQDLASQRNLALALTNAGRYEESMTLFRKIAAERPGDWKSQYELAGALGYIRRYAESVEPIEAAIRLRPDHIPAYQAATIIYARVGRFADAVAVTRKAAQLGDPVSMFDMYRFYDNGVGIKTDANQAFRWLRLAAGENHVEAMDRMAEVFQRGLLDQTPDPGKAEAWARKADRARVGG